MIPTIPSPHRFCETRRAQEIRLLGAYFDSTQYDGKPDFFTGEKANGEVVPLRERKPIIIYPLAKNAVQQVVRFCWGEGRFPKLKVEPVTAADAVGAVGLDENEAAELSKGIAEIIKRWRVRSVMRQVMTTALARRSSCAVFSVRQGRVVIDTPDPHVCWPVFQGGHPDGDVASLTICYQTDMMVEDPKLGLTYKRVWFRRDYDETRIIEYKPVEVRAGQKPDWRVESFVDHGFGFCPVVWFRNLPASSDALDGQSLYEEMFDEFDALNFAYSQRHRGVHIFGVPQPWETGVADDDGPEADGRRAESSAAGFQKFPGVAKKSGAMKASARRMAPDAMWSYQNDKAQVGLLEVSGAAFDTATKHVDDIRARCNEAMSVVLAGLDNAMGKGTEVTAKLLTLLYAPLLSLVDELRDACWWDDGLLKLLSMCMRILIATGGEGMLLPGAKKLADLAGRFVVETTDGRQMWMPPTITPIWGDYFTPSAAEVTADVTSAQLAKDSGLITAKTGTQFVAPHFGVEDVAAEVEAVASAAEEKAATDATRQAQMLEAGVAAKAKATAPAV
jgi:hypothetical protein